ncbi:MAG TPA: hypothetical protein VKB78_14525 [Pirellulales bacterium]|nr:hypothetical protein [Pirellulales bacterium]
MTKLSSRALALIAFVVAATVTIFPGCGGGRELPPRAKVTGKVTLDGKALPTGMVTFVPDKARGTSGPPAVGGIDSTGHYELTTDRQSDGDGAVVGFHQVRVIANEPAKDAMQSMTPSLIPLRYNNEASSGLRFEVKAGQDNEIDLPLTSKEK